MILILLLLPALSFSQSIETFYFNEKSGENQTIIYKVLCLDYKKEQKCNLRSLSIMNGKAKLKCSIAAEELIEWSPAKKVGETWILSVSQGACGYTNSYQISRSGMVQVKSSPKVKKGDFCDSFEPKTYSMKSQQEVSSTNIDTSGCDKMTLLSL